MQSQQLDTRIQVEAVNITRGASGGVQKDWTPHSQPWAQRRDLSGNERAASSAGGQVAVARVEFVLRERATSPPRCGYATRARSSTSSTSSPWPTIAAGWY